MSGTVYHGGLFPALVASRAATGMQVVVAEGTTGAVERFEITSVYVDELQQPPVGLYRPTHKGKVIAQWKSESRGRRS